MSDIARYLARSGVFPQTAVAFTPQGLLLRLLSCRCLLAGR